MPHADTFSQVYVPLRLTYGLVPLLAGIDKFTNLLVDWKAYLPSYVVEMLPISASGFMMAVGVIEIIAGLAVLTLLTRLGAYVVMAWLIMIALVVATAGHYDIAVRDLAMAAGAYALGTVAGWRQEPLLPGATVHSAGAPVAP